MKFGTDGVRGVAGTELTEEFAFRFGLAAARTLAAGRDPVVVIGGDTRESTPDFVDSLARGFAASGLDVIDLGVVPTPTVAFEAQTQVRLDEIDCLVLEVNGPLPFGIVVD